jgi:aromatic-amino-acid transaminase
MPSLFDAVEMAPRDPILGVSERFNADTRPGKVNLGVGVYVDEGGKIPLLSCVRAAEAMLVEAPQPRGYLPIDGIAAYDKAVRELVFGAASRPVREGTVATVQALGGTGGLTVGADLLKKLLPEATVLISDPSWENHRALFEQAGFAVSTYAYYDPARQAADVEAMLRDLAAAAPGTIVVLHACCHNPTGCDLAPDDWRRVIATVTEKRLVPFLDMAYQGFGDGIAEDRAVVDGFVEAGLDVFVSSSFSKSFSLYGERVGALSVATRSADQAARVLSQLKRVIRANYSNPPTHGAAVVSHVLQTPELRASWEHELAGMRTRIQSMRAALGSGLKEARAAIDAGFVTRQRGMFSYSGLTKAQMQALRERHGVYGLDSGRICVAALNEGNLPRVVEAITAVTKESP